MRRLLGVLAGMLLSALPARALDTCNGLIEVSFVTPPAEFHVGDTVRLHVDLGTGSIQGGTQLTATDVFYSRDCQPPLVPGCQGDPSTLAFAGNITTDCAGTTSTHQVVPGRPDEDSFAVTPPLVIPPNQAVPPGVCAFEFDVTITGGAGTTINGVVSFGENGVGAHCNNGLLVAGGFQTVSIVVVTTTTTTTTTSSTTTTTLALHFGCYQIPQGRIPTEPVSLDYRFGTVTAQVARIHQLCAPTDKNGEDPSAVASPVHMSALTVKAVHGTFTQPRGTTITTQFGTFTADVRKPAVLLAPTAKSLASPPPPLVTNEPHRLCTKLANVHGPAPTVHLEDQFTAPTGGINPSTSPRGPDLLCLPVDKNGQDPSAPSNPAALLCLRTRNDKLPFQSKTVFITNQFGSFKDVLTQYDFFCVPATVP